PPSYWPDLKQEFHEFLCTDSEKYADLRSKLSAYGKKSETTIVATISAVMAGYIGVASAALIPFCALCAIAALRMGREAFCRSTRLDNPALSER
ncbi:MAG TPA: hypothetical protein VGG86_08460, partial [Roseiarcus sp.]